MAELTPIIQEGFLQFAGAVLQSRALADARDCIKPSARQIFYCLYTDKFIHTKPFQKTLKAIGASFKAYIHGDSSAEGIIMRAGQPFAMRYPLIEVEGSYGTLLSAGSWAAPRYTSARLSALSSYLFEDIDKETIEEWRDNYDNTMQYPMTLPSKGFYNLCNGMYGIGVGASASIPQYNLKEMNEALIKLLWNPNISFDEIYVAPDFATGAIILNGNQVKESHRNGQGASCKIRSEISYDEKDRCFIVSEIPYMVYTDTICKELEELINGENNPGIDRFNDLTGDRPNIKIYLTKTANKDKVLQSLYKNTSLQSHYSINFTMLDRGRFPKVFTWKEALQAHIDHEIEVYVRAFEYDLKKINHRIHIIDGLLKALDMIDEVVATIRSSASTSAANAALRKLLNIDEEQAKAILEIKLARLAKLEINKLVEEKNGLLLEKNRIENILNNEILLKKEIENGLREVADKFGDSRRTKILNLQTIDVNEEEFEVIEEKQFSIGLSNKGIIYSEESSSLLSKPAISTKLSRGEQLINSCLSKNTDNIVLFTDKGNYYTVSCLSAKNKSVANNLFNNKNFENVIAMADNSKQYVVFITKQGYVKKTPLKDYVGKGKAINLSDDKIIKILFINEEDIALLDSTNHFLWFETKDISAIGKVARGVKGMKTTGEIVAAISIDFVPQKIVFTGANKETRSKTDLVKSTRYTKGTLITKSETINLVDMTIV